MADLFLDLVDSAMLPQAGWPLLLHRIRRHRGAITCILRNFFEHPHVVANPKHRADNQSTDARI